LPAERDRDGDCTWHTLSAALKHFALYTGKTESQRHIKPLHWHVACRLVIEGGFRPDEITPRPPFSIKEGRQLSTLYFDPELGGRGEQTILGGLKTKNVDVVVIKEGWARSWRSPAKEPESRSAT
jgi:hypothetical protein